MLFTFFRRRQLFRPARRRSARSHRLALEPLETRVVLHHELPGLPRLHSLPGAPAAVFIDFNGFGSSTPYDVDGNPTSFNATEQAQITEAWRQTAVYFAMFNLDVTTEHPSIPFAWGMIRNNHSGPGFCSINAFPNTQPRCFNPSSDARARQSGIPHEFGHNFGLQHQSDYDLMGNKIREYSSGYDDLHGPLMGVDFARSVHKWFIGHPSNSPSLLQDDLARTAANIHRFEPASGDGYRPDDYGGTLTSATPLGFFGTYQFAYGILERLNDADAFAFFTGGGTLQIDAVPDRPSGVDLKLEIYDSAGALLAASDANTNDQHLTMKLPGGVYYAVLTSHGDYGDVGAYGLTVRSLTPGSSSTQDIGTVGVPGYSAYNEGTGTLTVAGSGADVGGTADGFRYVYQRLNGDGGLLAYVSQVENSSAAAKVGLMIRDGLGNNVRHVSLTATYGNGPQLLSRETAGGATTTVAPYPGLGFSPYWLLLDRSGDTFTGLVSFDGSTWELLGQATMPMSSTAHVGLFTSAANQSRLNNGTLDYVIPYGDILPGTPDPIYNLLPAPTGLVLAHGTGTGINLGWNAVTGATGYAIDRSANGVTWTQVGTTAAGVTTFGNTGLTGSQRWFYRVSALSGATRSAPSAVAHLVNRPSAPFNVTVTSWMSTRLIVNWRDVNGDTGYRIERSLDGTTFTTVGTVGRNNPSFTDQNLTAATTYFYRLVATSPFGDSPFSAVVFGTTRAAGPGVPDDPPSKEDPGGAMPLPDEGTPGHRGHGTAGRGGAGRAFDHLAHLALLETQQAVAALGGVKGPYSSHVHGLAGSGMVPVPSSLTHATTVGHHGAFDYAGAPIAPTGYWAELVHVGVPHKPGCT